MYPLSGRKYLITSEVPRCETHVHPVFYLPAATLLFEWFQQKRGFASGIMYAGTGAGGTVFPFIMQGLLNRFQYRASMISLVRPLFIKFLTQVLTLEF